MQHSTAMFPRTGRARSADRPIRPACQQQSPGLFFGREGEPTGERNQRVALAKGVCASCPIRTACLDGALDRREPYGVWGGLTTAERNNLLFRRAQH